MTRSLPRHLLRMVLGYLASVVAAALTATVALSVIDPPSSAGDYPTIMAMLIDKAGGFLAVWLAASVFIAIMAFPVWAVVAFISELSNIRARYAYLATGMLAAVPFLLGQSGNEPNKISFWLISLLSGLAGGYVYWRIAGRYAGLSNKQLNRETVQ